MTNSSSSSKRVWPPRRGEEGRTGVEGWAEVGGASGADGGGGAMGPAGGVWWVRPGIWKGALMVMISRTAEG